MSGLIRRRPTLVPLAALLALLAVNLLVTPNFGNVEIRGGRLHGSMVDIVQNGAPVMLCAIGMTLVIAIAGIDLSVGSVMAMAGGLAALAMTEGDQPVWAAVLAGLGLATAAGLWNGALVTYGRLQPIIATLIMLVAGRGIALALTGDQKVGFERPVFQAWFSDPLAYVPAQVYIVAVVAIGVAICLRKTVLGLYVEAIGGNARAARLCGIRVHGIRLAVYGFSGLCAGVAGLIAAADIKQADVANCGVYVELDAILAVVIGGTSLTGGRPRLLGALIGAAIMQTLTIMLQMHGINTEHALIVKAIVAIGVMLMQAPRLAGVWNAITRSPARTA